MVPPAASKPNGGCDDDGESYKCAHCQSLNCLQRKREPIAAVACLDKQIGTVARQPQIRWQVNATREGPPAKRNRPSVCGRSSSEACSSDAKHVWHVFGPRSTKHRVKAYRPSRELRMSSQPILRCSNHAPSVTRRNGRNFADPCLDERQPVIPQCDERNFPHRCAVVSGEDHVPLKPKDKGGETAFNEPSQTRHSTP